MTLHLDPAPTLQRPCVSPAQNPAGTLAGFDKGGLTGGDVIHRPYSPAPTLQTLSTLRAAR